MSKLSAFFENFEMENNIKIYDKNDNLVFDGKMSDVPEEMKNMADIIIGSAKWNGRFLVLKVKKV